MIANKLAGRAQNWYCSVVVGDTIGSQRDVARVRSECCVEWIEAVFLLWQCDQVNFSRRDYMHMAVCMAGQHNLKFNDELKEYVLY